MTATTKRETNVRVENIDQTRADLARPLPKLTLPALACINRCDCRDRVGFEWN